MAEVEADSTGTPNADSDPGFDLGADLETSIAAPPEPTSEPTATDSTPSTDGRPSADAGTTDFDPRTVDFATADPESLPEPYREAQSWAKNRERELQADYTRKTQELADFRRQIEQLQESLTRQQTAAPTAAPAADALAELRQRLGEDAPAIDVVQDIVKAMNAGTQDQAEASTKQLTELQTTVQALAQAMVSQQSNGLNQQVLEAREAYGTALDGYADQIKALIQVPNLVTGQHYTVKEAFEVVSGKAQKKSQELASSERQVRSDASQHTALHGAVGAANTDDGDLTPAQLHAGLKQLGFE